MFIESGMTRDLFADFLSDIQALLLEEDIFIFYDNAPSYSAFLLGPDPEG